MVSVLRVLVIVLVGFYFITLALIIHNEISYGNEMPKEPQPECGRVHQISVNHGIRIYVNDSELRRRNVLITLFSIGGACGLVAGVLNVKYSIFKSPPGPSPR